MNISVIINIILYRYLVIIKNGIILYDGEIFAFSIKMSMFQQNCVGIIERNNPIH